MKTRRSIQTKSARVLLSSNERRTGLWSVVFAGGRTNSRAYSLCAGDTLLALLHFPVYQQQCIRAFPDTGQLSDRRLLWSGCQTLIWANIEEHSAIASMIAASCSPLWASRHVNKSESTYLEMFSNFAFLLFHFYQLLIRVNESRIKANLPTTN